MLLTTKQLLTVAYKHGYAIPAFNVNNLEMIQGALRAAHEARSPVIIQTAREEIEYAGDNTLYDIVTSVGRQYDVPFALHLDHGPNFETAVECLRKGYTSVMFDGSALPFEENRDQTRRVVDAAHAVGVSVEAELGKLGGLNEMGTEDREAALTDPVKAQEFVEATDVDIFAPAIGTAHGFYKGEPFLDFPRLEEINGRIGRPLVLHGGSGLSAEAVKTGIGYGISKINFSTSLRKAFLDAAKDYMEEHPEDLMTMNVLAPAVEAFKEMAVHLIKMCGADGKASLYRDLVSEAALAGQPSS
jgi:ketose-bisphosphate aldolase